jgi:S1-C subfamily serine protease
VDVLDWIVILLAVGALVHGLRVGAAVQLLSFVGGLIGLVVGVVLLAILVPHFSSDFVRTFVSLLLLILPCGLVAGIGRQVGARLWGRMRGHALAHVDAAAGAAIAVAGTLVFVWLLATIMVNSPVPSIVSQIEDSAIIQGVGKVMPELPTSELASLERLLTANGALPIVLPPGPVSPVTLPGSGTASAVVEEDGRSTVQVTAFGCDGGLIVEKGSGFVVAPGLVVTNAHVVAGSTRIVVSDEAGFHDASPVLFDPRYDLAVLRVPGLDDPVLHLDPGYVARGRRAVVLGYPLGRPALNAQPAGVMLLLDATGYDIYQNVLTQREMYEIQSLVREGNSGGPLVLPDGEVIGVVFSRQANDDHIGYALASPGVLARVRRAERRPPGYIASTQRCLATG